MTCRDVGVRRQAGRDSKEMDSYSCMNADENFKDVLAEGADR